MRLGWTFVVGIAAPFLWGIAVTVAGYGQFALATSCFILGGLMLLGVTAMWAWKKWPLNPRQIGTAIGLALLAICAPIIGTIWAAKLTNAQTRSAGEVVIAQNTIGPINNNQGIITQGQSGGTNIVVPRAPPRKIDGEFENLIREHFPDKSKEMAVMVLTGDDQNERSHFAGEIQDFLKSDGYKVRPIVYFIAVGEVPQGVVIDQYTDPGAILIKVGVNNRQ